MARLLALCLALLSLSLAGCVSPPAQSHGADWINGAITTGPMRKMAPLASRGFHTIGLVMESSPTVTLQEVGLTVFSNTRDASPRELVSAAEKRTLFREEFTKASDIRLVDLASEQATLLDAFKVSSWDGEAKLQSSPAADALINQLRARGLDAVLVVRESEVGDFIGMTNVRLAPLGLYKRFNTVAAHGGYRVVVIDLRTRVEVPHTHYTQATSRAFSGPPWKEKFADYLPHEQTTITAALKDVIRQNARETVAMLKADRGAR